ncbi:MAG: sugar ABC transporter ATP-binding protein [Bradyrhizobiaceae bacterium]|nr:sugar ABC transporter ATP-binding protein [Bradyrhizobiaceae bacterium]
MSKTVLLAGSGLRKAFGGVQAVRGVDFTVSAGEVHALVGENGAGKSTLVKMLSGVVEPDSGTISWLDKPVALRSPANARALGIQVIHQELELMLPLSVAENIFLGALPSRGGFVNRRKLYGKAREVLEGLGASIDPAMPVRDLYIADRQVVEIARALVGNARVLFLDEPTAALPPVETQKLMAAIGRLREQGVGLIYVSHKLDEVIQIGDRISVMRDGRKVAELERGTTTRESLVEQILGRELKNLTLEKGHKLKDKAVRVENLRAAGALEGVSFDAGKGEIVGFFGLLGAGQSAIPEILFGFRDADADAVEMGTLNQLPSSPAQAIRAGLGFVPSDRKGAGLALNLPIWENLLMTDLGRVTRGGFIRRELVDAECNAIVDQLDIRCSSIDQQTGNLSGGNQQKIVLGKWHHDQTDILLLDEPTRGVDVGAKAEIYRLLHAYAASGGCCLVFSSDAEEVATLCNRAYAMRHGQITRQIDPSNLDVPNLIAAAL